MIHKKTTYYLLFVLFAGISCIAQPKKWTLQECVDYALKNNISIKNSELDKKLAEIDRKAAMGSFFPNLNSQASHSWSIGSNTNPVTNIRENKTTQFSSFGLSSNIDIYNGLQNQNRFRRAKMAQLAAQYQQTKMQDDVSLMVANAYLNILFNKENLKVQKEQFANNERQYNRSDELVKAGVLPRGDLLDSKATVTADKQRIVVAENTLLISKLSLGQLLQLDDFQNFDVEDIKVDVTPSETLAQKPETIYEKALQERIEIKIAKTNLEIAEKDIKIAKGAYQPSLSGGYSFSTSASYSDILTGVDANGNPVYISPKPAFEQFSDNKGHNFGLQLNVPIFNGFSVKNNVERSKVAYERAKTADTQAKLDLERNVFTAITDAKGALNAYESALATLDARKQAFDYASERLAVGMMNSFDFNQAQTLYVNAQSDAIRARYDYIFKVKVVEFYFGIPIIQKQ